MGDVDMRKSMLLAVVAVILLAVAPGAEARVVRFVVEQSRPFADGQSFGSVGAYVRLDGTVVIEVDPRDPLDAIIVNLDKAPKNGRGMVEFTSPVFILKPADMMRGNQKIYYGVNNRGNKTELRLRTILPVTGPMSNNNLLTAADVADALMLRLGYTYVDAGWQGNVAPANDRLVPSLPVAMGADGRPIIGKVRVEYADFVGFTRPLGGSAGFRSYEPVDVDTTRATLTVRSTVGGARTPIPSNRWAFGRCGTGPASLVPTTTDICLFDGFKVENLYELIYPAKNPSVMGLGYAVTRDVASFLRYQTRDDVGNPNPLAVSSTNVGIRRAYVSGTSSTGMYLRDWLYLGFNEDEAHRKVFDAATITTPGTHRLFANVEFSDPNTYAGQDDHHDLLSASYPPLTFAVTTDPISGIRDGILKRPATDPLVFQVDSSGEFWQFNGSLNVVDGRGQPVPIPDNVRLYYAAGFQHGGVAGLLNPPGQRRFTAGTVGMCQSLVDGGGASHGWSPTLRALLIAIDDWADRGIEPPKSNYPILQDGTLVTIDAARAVFPAIPHVAFPTAMNELELPNFGPGFGSTGGHITQLPPVLGARYQSFVPKADRDGLDIGGIRTVEVSAPLATVTGWNVRLPGRRAGDLCGLWGSFIPFAKTKAERQANVDPRPSLEERYTDEAGFVKAVEAAARALVKQRFLLEEDVDRYVKAAGRAFTKGL
jgi:hypothetical protein